MAEVPRRVNAAQLAARKIRQPALSKRRVVNGNVSGGGDFNSVPLFASSDAPSFGATNGGGLFGGAVQAPSAFNFSAPVQGISFGSTPKFGSPDPTSASDPDPRQDTTGEEVARRNKPFRIEHNSSPAPAAFNNPFALANQPNGTEKTIDPLAAEVQRTNSPFQIAPAQSAQPSSGFSFGGASTQEKPANNIFSFNQPQSTTPSFSFGSTTAQPANNIFSFPSSAPQSQPATTSAFSFNSTPANAPSSAPTFSFGQTSTNAHPVSSGISFGATPAADKPAGSLFSFGNNQTTPQPSTPTVNFGGTSAEQPKSSIFNFNQPPSSSSFNFNQPSATSNINFNPISAPSPSVNVFQQSNMERSSSAPNLFGQPKTQSSLPTNLFSISSVPTTSAIPSFGAQSQESNTANMFSSPEPQRIPASSQFATQSQEPTLNSTIEANDVSNSKPASSLFAPKAQEPGTAISFFNQTAQPSAPQNLFASQDTAPAPSLGNGLQSAVQRPASPQETHQPETQISTPSLFGLKSGNNFFGATQPESATAFGTAAVSGPANNIFASQFPKPVGNLFGAFNQPTPQLETESTAKAAISFNAVNTTTATEIPSASQLTKIYQSEPAAQLPSVVQHSATTQPSSVSQPGDLLPAVLDNNIFSKSSWSSQHSVPNLRTIDEPESPEIVSTIEPPSTSSNAATWTTMAPHMTPKPFMNGVSGSEHDPQHPDDVETMGLVEDEVIAAKTPARFNAKQRVEFARAFRIRALNVSFLKHLATFPLAQDFSIAFSHYQTTRAVLQGVSNREVAGLPNGEKRKADSDLQPEGESSTKRSKLLGEIGFQTSDVLSSNLTPAKPDSIIRDSATPKVPPPSAPTLFAQPQPSAPQISPSGTTKKRKADVQITQLDPTGEGAEVLSQKVAKSNGTTGSETSNLFKSILADSNSSEVESPAKSKMSTKKVSDVEETPRRNPFASLPMPGSSAPASKPFALKAGSSALNLFSPQPSSTPSNLFATKPAFGSGSSLFVPKDAAQIDVPSSTLDASSSTPNPFKGASALTFPSQLNSSNMFTIKDASSVSKEAPSSLFSGLSTSNIFAPKDVNAPQTDLAPKESLAAGNIFAPKATSDVATSNIFAAKATSDAATSNTFGPKSTLSPASSNIFAPKATSGPATSNIFAPKATSDAATSNLFAPKSNAGSATPSIFGAQTTVPSNNSLFNPQLPAISDSIFAPKPVLGSPSSNPFAPKPKATEASTSSSMPIKPPNFGTGPINFLAQFGQQAEKYSEESEVEAMNKAKMEDFDSDDDDEAEWEAKYKAKRAADKKATEELAKTKRAAFVPGKGFSFGETAKETEKPRSPPRSVFSKPSGLSAPTPSIFASLNGSRTSSPGAASSTGSVLENPVTNKSAFGNIFGHLSDAESGAESGKGNEADDDETDEDEEEYDDENEGAEEGDEDDSGDSNEDLDEEKKDPTYQPNTDESGGVGTPVENTGVGIASGKKPLSTFSFGSSATSGTNTPTPTAGRSLFERITRAPAPATEDKENAVPQADGVVDNPFTKYQAKPAAESLKSQGDNTWKPDSPIRFGTSTPTTPAPPTVSVTAPSPAASPAVSNLFNVTSAPRPASPFAGLFGNSTSKPATPSLFANLGGTNNKQSVGFSFGAPSNTSSLFPSTAASTTSSRATSPGFTTDGDSANDTGDPDGVQHEQIDLTSGGAGEEEEDVILQVRAKANKYNISQEPGVPSAWVTQGLGPLKILKNKETAAARILMRADPSGKIVLNKAILSALNYEANGKTVKVLTSDEAGKGLETWLLQVKTPESAKELAAVLEKNKGKA